MGCFSCFVTSKRSARSVNVERTKLEKLENETLQNTRQNFMQNSDSFKQKTQHKRRNTFMKQFEQNVILHMRRLSGGKAKAKLKN